MRSENAVQVKKKAYLICTRYGIM